MADQMAQTHATANVPTADAAAIQAIASRHAAQGNVEGFAFLATDKAHRSWVEQDVAEIKTIVAPEARAEAFAHLVSNAAAPDYAWALRGVNPDLAKEVDQARALQIVPPALPVAANGAPTEPVAITAAPLPPLPDNAIPGSLNLPTTQDDAAVASLPAANAIASPVQLVQSSPPVPIQAEAVAEKSTASVDGPSASAAIPAQAADTSPPSAVASTPAASDATAQPGNETPAAVPRARPEGEREAENSIAGLGGVRLAPAELERQKQAPGVTARLLEALSRPFTGARPESEAQSQSQPPGEMRAPAVMTKTGYAIPEDIAARYVVRDGRFWKFDGKDPGQSGDHDPHFEDHGARLATPANDRTTAADMIAVAQAKGWGEIQLKGSDEFKRNAWIEASLSGIATKGFKPEEQDLAMLDAARREREALTISAGTRAKPMGPAAVASPAVASPVMPIAPAAQAPAHGVTPPAAVSAPVADQTPAAPSILVAHGPAPYQNVPENSRSYFVTVKDAAGTEQTSWGLDLERAISDSGVQIGEPVKLDNLGSQPVVVQAPVKDATGKVIGFEPKEARRNVWSVERDGPAVAVKDVREELEKALAGVPENVRRVVMDQFAETMAAGLKVQDEHVRSNAPAEALGPALDARLAEVTQERLVRETPPPAPKRDNPGQGAPALTH